MAAAVDPDPRGQNLDVSTQRIPSPVSFDDVSTTEFKRIAGIPWFNRTSVLAEAENDFSNLALYAWDRELFWDVCVEALSSRVSQRVILT